VASADYATARDQRGLGIRKDLTTDLRRFDELAHHLPPGAIRIAESGIHPENAARRSRRTRLPRHPGGHIVAGFLCRVCHELARFEQALSLT